MYKYEFDKSLIEVMYINKQEFSKYKFVFLKKYISFLKFQVFVLIKSRKKDLFLNLLKTFFSLIIILMKILFICIKIYILIRTFSKKKKLLLFFRIFW